MPRLRGPPGSPLRRRGIGKYRGRPAPRSAPAREPPGRNPDGGGVRRGAVIGCRPAHPRLPPNDGGAPRHGTARRGGTTRGRPAGGGVWRADAGRARRHSGGGGGRGARAEPRLHRQGVRGAPCRHRARLRGARPDGRVHEHRRGSARLRLRGDARRDPARGSALTEGVGGMENTRKRLGRGMTRRQFLDGTLAIAGAAAAPVLPHVLGTAAASPAAASAAPAGELKVSLPARIVALDPLGPQAAEEPVRIVAAHVFDSLVVRDTKTRQYLPSLATKWESPDPTTWVFTLRPGVKFHDGTPLTARDVKASLDRMLKLRGPFAPLWG